MAFIVSVVAVLFQRDLKNTGTPLFKSLIEIKYRGKGIIVWSHKGSCAFPHISLHFMRNSWFQYN